FRDRPTPMERANAGGQPRLPARSRTGSHNGAARCADEEAGPERKRLDRESRQSGQTVPEHPDRRAADGSAHRPPLQTVFHHTEETISRAELVAHALANPDALGEGVERLQRCSDAQLRVSPTRDELLRLDEELDLANAAASELDVVPLNRD